MDRQPPRSTRTATLFPYPTLFRSDPVARQKAERRLRQALTPPRQKLLTQFTGLPQGVKFLVDMRADALRFRKETPELAIVDADLEDLFVAWFDVGFLELQRITWNSPAALLEKLIAYRSEERRVGKGCVSTCKSRWSPYH